MTNVKIVTVPDGDWQGLYIDNKLVEESHKIRMCDLIQYCPIHSIEEYHLKEFDGDTDALEQDFRDLAKFQIEVL